ncbi:RNA-splicing factor [Entophlyctis sp. JEL0112]|nr:RNA-splicing factor [Entophlyctis sp. JEL0112]
MGGGDLNLKKSWHPQTLKNIEKVYLREKKAEDEKKKIAQKLKEIAEQRQMLELQALHEASGKIKKKQEKINWMYAAPGEAQEMEEDREAYLLGKKRIDKLVDPGATTAEMSAQATFSATAALIYGANANSDRDMGNKIREDPLLAIKKREQASLQAVINNPVRIQALKAEREASAAAKSKKKESKKNSKKSKKHHHDAPSDNNDGIDSGVDRELSDSSPRKRLRSNRESDEKQHSEITARGPNGRDNDASHWNAKKDAPRDGDGYRYRDYDRDRDYRDRKIELDDRTARNYDDRESSHYNGRSRRYETQTNRRDESRSEHFQYNGRQRLDREAEGESSRRRDRDGDRGQSEMDDARKRRLDAMMANAKQADQERHARIEKAREKEVEEAHRETELRMKRLRDGFDDGMVDIGSVSGLNAADMIRRNRHTVQRGDGEFL